MISRRDFLKLGGVTLLAAAFSNLDPAGTDSTLPLPSPIYRGSGLYPRIAMTFDDCWHPEVLEQLSEMVVPYPGFHFTFFAIGDAIMIDETIRPGIWKQLYEKGHEIGYHTFHHVDPIVMSSKNLIADFDEWMNTLHQVLGFQPDVHFARPPYDDITPSFQVLCRERGLVATLYSIGYEASNTDQGLNYAVRTQNGDIVQMHTYEDPNNNRLDVSITAKVLPYLADRGFQLVTMTELYNDLLREKNSSSGCDIGSGASLTRTCLE
jgi:peptidoglycan/xylan/chitin deacetylase (PgdA/CDA1 family)